jgi:hypothetical protein
LITVPVADLLAEGRYPQAHLLLSLLRSGNLEDPIGVHMGGDPRQFVLTFNNLIGQTDFVRTLREMLSQLEEAYGKSVDTEFTASVGEDGQVRLNLLQCRPMLIPGTEASVTLPRDLASERILFRADRLICGGVVSNIRFIVYIPPEEYGALADRREKGSIGRIVGRLTWIWGST